MKATIGVKTVWKQLVFDLIGKDSHRGITLTYGWLANQFGHFALGYIPTILFYSLLTLPNNFSNPSLWAVLLTIFLWTSFEAYNFLGPLFKTSHVNPFKPDWYNVGFDTFSDLLFFYTGAFAAVLLYDSSVLFLILFFLLLLSTFLLFAYWYPIKMYTQYAFFPFQSRISQWNHPILNQSITDIQAYLNQPGVQHVLIFGGDNSGKTSLAVSIATERSIRKDACFYTTGIKFLSLLQKSNADCIASYQIPWSWRDVECIVVDDINAGEICNEVLSPDLFRRALENKNFIAQNTQCIQTTSIIWVIGKNELKTSWVDFLESYNVNDLIIINLHS